VPLAVILGQDELAAGKVRVKALGLPDGHPEKEGVLVEKEVLVTEVRKRLQK
jgi:histidyl-tRNA synthetase